MRCRTARRRLSDAFDGALPPGRKARLEAHLESCPACRSYRGRIARIQKKAGTTDDRPPGGWEAFERSVEARIDAAEGRRPVASLPAGRRRWAWAVAAASLLVAVTAWYALRRQAAAPIEAWAAYEDGLAPLMLAAEDDRDLAARVDGEVRSLIEETVQAPDPEAVVLPAADPLFWEGLSEDDLEAIVRELEELTAKGGPA